VEIDLWRISSPTKTWRTPPQRFSGGCPPAGGSTFERRSQLPKSTKGFLSSWKFTVAELAKSSEEVPKRPNFGEFGYGLYTSVVQTSNYCSCKKTRRSAFTLVGKTSKLEGDEL